MTDETKPTEPQTGITPPAIEESEKKLSQAEVDKLMGTARNEGKKKALKDFLESSGLESEDQLKELIKSLKEKEDAEKSELQREKENALKLQKTLEEVKQEVERKSLELVNERLNKQIEKALTGAKELEDTIILFKNRVNLSNVITDDKKIDEKKLNEIVDKFKKDYPKYFASNSGAGSPSNGSARQSYDGKYKIEYKNKGW